MFPIYTSYMHICIYMTFKNKTWVHKFELFLDFL